MATAPHDSLSLVTGIPEWIFGVTQGNIPTPRTVLSVEEGFRLLANKPGTNGQPLQDGERIFILYQLIPLVSTLKEAKLLATFSMRRSDKLLGQVQKRWNEIGQERVKEAQSFSDITVLLPELPPQSRARREALEKAALFMRTYAEAKVLYSLARDDWHIQYQAVKGMIDFASTLADARAAYSHCDLGDPLQVRALNRWNALAQKALDEAETLEQIRNLVRQLMSGSEAVEYAAKRALEISAFQLANP